MQSKRRFLSALLFVLATVLLSEALVGGIFPGAEPRLSTQVLAAPTFTQILLRVEGILCER